MKVMTFNLRHIIKEDLLGLWRKRYKRIVTFILNENPDIIGVQELTHKGKRYLKRNLKEYKIIGKKRHSIIFTNEYNCVLVKNLPLNARAPINKRSAKPKPNKVTYNLCFFSTGAI